MKLAFAGALMGLVAGVFDCALFYVMGQPITLFDVGTAVTFWTGVGVVISTVEIGMPPVVKGVGLAVLLNIPWAINFSGMGMVELLIPMIPLALIYGAAMGFLSGKFAIRAQAV